MRNFLDSIFAAQPKGGSWECFMERDRLLFLFAHPITCLQEVERDGGDVATALTVGCHECLQ